MNQRHTPTPWHIDEHGDIRCENDSVICDLAGYSDAKENAEFIVRACNAHDDLVAITKAAKAFFPGSWHSDIDAALAKANAVQS
jgi:hypothetical protein